MVRWEEIQLNDHPRIERIRQFLRRFDLTLESNIDYLLGGFHHDKIVATAGKSGNVLKGFAVDPDYQGEGVFIDLLSRIEDRLLFEGRYHFFIFTRSTQKEKFKSLGYHEIMSAKQVSLLEKGDSIVRYLKRMKQIFGISEEPAAAIVMNGNPFTLGHRSLIERAAKENERVLVFVVSEDRSTFPFKDRFQLIEEGVQDLPNVKVLETGPYLVSNVTFPSYFLPSPDVVLDVQTTIDCMIFGTYYQEAFQINRRYIGSEPYCPVTRIYNQRMHELLPKYGIAVIEVERHVSQETVISASHVRKHLIEGNIEALKAFVPEVTYNYLRSEKAVPYIEALRKKQGRH